MLTTLHINNFAIVKHLELDLQSGMTAFTGETGAGKSIMIDALMLALGGRGDTAVIRPGEEKCDISATFTIDIPSQPSEWLIANEVDLNDGILILRRIITKEGRSKSFINGQPFSLQKVKELSEMLVHIHGQHEHQTLLNHTTHRFQLDAFANHHDLLENVQTLYKTHQSTKQKIQAINESDSQKDKLALLAFQIKELSELTLSEDELPSLNIEHQQLHHANDYLTHTQSLLNIIHEQDDFNISLALHQCIQTLQSLPSENADIQSALELCNTALIHLEEAKDNITHFASRITLSPERLSQVESRLSLLHKMARKYQCEPQALYEKLASLQQDYDTIKQSSLTLQSLIASLELTKTEYDKAALMLRQSRVEAATRLSKLITEGIQPLGMPHGYLTIDISPLDTMQAHGQDKIEYKVCTNPGMMPDTLSKVVSGGELSRISLAIQIITAERASTPTLLFDEVDVGIGGNTATLVGQMLKTLGERLQVFCVTHQPQVAAHAHHQFKVAKQSAENSTFSEVVALVNDGRQEEIARMLGSLSAQSLLHAKELLQACHA